MSESTTIEIKDLKKAWEDTKNLLENEFKKTVQGSKDELKSYGEQLGQTKEQMAKYEAVFQKYDAAFEAFRAAGVADEQKRAALEAKIEIAEKALLEMKRLPAGANGKQRAIKEELKKFYSDEKAFTNFVQHGEENMTREERKALATDADYSGGFLVTSQFEANVIELNVLWSPLRQIADVMTISKGDTLEMPREGSTVFEAQWVNEREERTETTSGTFDLLKIPTHELEANPWVTQKMLDDSAVDVEGSYIPRKVAQQFAKKEGTAFISGNGVNRPQGISLGGSSTVNVTTTDAFVATKLITLQYSLEEPYASSAYWVSSRANFGQIRGLLATAGDLVAANFLWQPGLTPGAAPLLLGSPYLSCPDVTLLDSSATSSTQHIYYGDFKSGYRIVDRLGIRVIRDMLTKKPKVQFTTYKRVGGQVVLPEAIKIGVAL